MAPLDEMVLTLALADENFPGAAVTALGAAGHDVVWVRIAAPGMTDPVAGSALDVSHPGRRRRSSHFPTLVSEP